MPKTTRPQAKKTSEEVESSEPGTLVKVKAIKCLYRYSSKGTYYALIKHQGKQKRQWSSPEKADRYRAAEWLLV